MFKRWMTVCIVLTVMLAVFGCSDKKAEETTTDYSEQIESVIIAGNQYVLPIEEQTFYCMRVKDNYYKFVYPGCYADLLSADDPSLFPDIEEGYFAKVTADIEETKSSFGFYPIISTVSTRIVTLKESEPMEFDAITKVFDVTVAGSEEVRPDYNIFQYTHDGKLYLIFREKGKITAYSEDGLLIEYRIENAEIQFGQFFKALK